MAKKIAISLADETFERLERAAARSGKSTTEQARDAIEEALADIDDLRLAEEATLRLKRGESGTISLDELGGGLAWTIEVEDEVAKDIAKLGKPVATRIYRFLRDRLSVLDNPRSIGKALMGSTLGNYWSYRVGDYRIVCDLQDDRLVVVVVRAGHRSQVYD